MPGTPSHSTVRSGVETLPDGRLRCWIEHDTLQGVTPSMLDWWFRHLEGDMDFEGQRLPRYRVWHPVDHIEVTYTQHLADGGVGVGAQLHIVEMFGGNPRHKVDALSDIVRLGEQGFGHRPQWHGLRVAAMDYRFAFDHSRAHAWILHNIEEVGQFERFLPALFAREGGVSLKKPSVDRVQ
ncbi:DAPG hydrolase family protein [Hydrogenophaga sp.]|uniref:DAPG hydrolase family protein n=1 Tax=Hydrogenophaga sp. TaxID=1904254 RepID=UPI002716B79F|nr:hypothetical protein [Hydrogenophaga sp.]MDO9133249.1 hypothetical protein [Hydrogenophaga sp.]